MPEQILLMRAINDALLNAQKCRMLGGSFQSVVDE